MLSEKLLRRKSTRKECDCLTRWSSTDSSDWSCGLLFPSLYNGTSLHRKHKILKSALNRHDCNCVQSASCNSSLVESVLNCNVSNHSKCNLTYDNKKTLCQQRQHSSTVFEYTSSTLSKCSSITNCNVSLLSPYVSYVPIQFCDVDETIRRTMLSTNQSLYRRRLVTVSSPEMTTDKNNLDLVFKSNHIKNYNNISPLPTTEHVMMNNIYKYSRRSNRIPKMNLMVPAYVEGFIIETNEYEANDTVEMLDQEAITCKNGNYRFQYVNICDYYRNYFVGKEHCNLIFLDSLIGLAVLSLKREAGGLAYRSILRTSENSKYAIFDCTKCTDINPATLCVAIARQLNTTLSKFDIESISYLNCFDASDKILSFDERIESKTFKFGIILQKQGQTTEEQILHNSEHTPQFDDFLETIADKINLRNFMHYRGGLDTSGNTESYYTTFEGKEIMFHVCTMLPFTPGDHQQLQRKRHIGNDIVVIVFQDSDCTTFSPDMLQSNFVHCIIVVQPIVKIVPGKNIKQTEYKVSVLRRNDVPAFGPKIPYENVSSGNLRNFILTKLIHAEYACYRANKFLTLQTRTRQSLLQSLVHQLRPDIEPVEYFSKSPKIFQYAITIKDSVMQLTFVDNVRRAINRKLNNLLMPYPSRTKSLPSKFPIELKMISECQLEILADNEQKIKTDQGNSARQRSTSVENSLSKITEDVLKVSDIDTGQVENSKGRISADSLNDEGVDLDFPYSKDSGSESPDRIRSSFNSLIALLVTPMTRRRRF